MTTDGEPDVPPTGRPGAHGRPAVLAGALVTAAGLLDVLAEFHLFTTRPYVLMADGDMTNLQTTGWTRLHLILGVGILLAGLVIATGRIWAVVVGLCFVATGITTDIIFMPLDPLHSMMAVGFHVTALVVLFQHRRDLPTRHGSADRVTRVGRPDR